MLEEFGREVTWPLQVKSDSSGAVAFQGGNVFDTKLKGCFDKREAWVTEMQDLDILEARKIDKKINWSDMMTKCLKGTEFRRQVEGIIQKSNSNFGEHL